MRNSTHNLNFNKVSSSQRQEVADVFYTHKKEYIQNCTPEKKPFLTKSPEEELKELQLWRIPAEVFYVWEAGQKLFDIDNNRIHIYSLIVNNGIYQMFIQLGGYGITYDHPHLWEWLSKTEQWIDIWTGNGLVSNDIAFCIISQISSARRDLEIKYFRNLYTIDESDEAHAIAKHFLKDKPKQKPDFISCDLSKESLNHAEELAHNHYYDLTKFFDLHYYPDTFEKLLTSDGGKTGRPRLITMFNVLANFEEKDLITMLEKIYASMRPWDVFIPTFFRKEDSYEKAFHHNVFQWVPFDFLSCNLYENPETKDRIVSSFCKRYEIAEDNVLFDVYWDNDGRDFISVDISVPPDTILQLPKSDWTTFAIKAKDLNQKKNKTPNRFRTLSDVKSYKMMQDSMKQSYGSVTFTALKSYRMSKKYIQNTCEKVWFKIDGWLYSWDQLQIAPVLYKI